MRLSNIADVGMQVADAADFARHVIADSSEFWSFWSKWEIYQVT